MITALIKLKYFFRKYLRNQILAVVFLFLSYFVTFAKPYLIGKLSDNIVSQNINPEEFYRTMMFLGFIIVFNYFINIGWSFNLFKNIYLISRDTRNALMTKFLKQSPEFFEKNSTGSLMGKATNDIEAMSTIVGYGIMTIFDGILYPLVVVMVMLNLSIPLTIFVLLAFPPFVYVLYRTNLKLEDKFRKLQESFDALNEITLESISSVKVIRAFNVEDVFRTRFRVSVEDNAKKDMDKNTLNQIYMPYAIFLNSALTALTIVGGIFMIRRGTLTIGELIAYTMYVNMLGWPAFALSDLMSMSKEGNTSIDRINEVMDYKEDIVDVKDSIELARPESFKFVNYSFKYPSSDRLILEDLDLEFNSGDTIIIVGKTGSGKSTLIKQFLRFYDKEEGELLINEIPIENYVRRTIIDKIAYVPQENYLFSKSIKDNIRFFRDYDEDEIMKASVLADFKKDLDNLPKGLETMTGEKGVALSGGQRQRIALSRALIKESDILILDDVFSAVDTRTEKNIIENLENDRHGKTNIFATHRLSVIKPTDTIIVLDDGKISAKGSHLEVYESSPWYREQYDLQLAEVDNE